METRQAYKEKYQAQIDEWGAKVQAMEAKARKARARVTIDVAHRMDGVREKLSAARAKLEEIARATDDEWDHLRAGADEAWKTLVSSAEGVLSALEPEAKKGNQPPKPS